MKRLIILSVLLPISLFGYSQRISEILGRPTNCSITISVLADYPIEAYFEYGVNSGNLNLTTRIFTSDSQNIIEEDLEGLNENTRYYYRTIYRAKGASVYISGELHSFVTQRETGSAFRFTVEADPHPYDKKGYHPLFNIALNNQLKDAADFMIDMGDTFGDDHNPYTITSNEIRQLQLNCRGFFDKVCHSIPLYFCIGNHEGEGGYYLMQTPPNNLAIFETLWRKQFYPNPYPNEFYSGNTEEEASGIGYPENYYAWEWGDALFVVLDMYRYSTKNEKPQKWDWTIGKTQYDWFKKTLENSHAKYKFVFSHHILGQGRGGVELAQSFEWGGYDAGAYKFDTYRSGWGLPIHQLMKQNNVDIYFQGHDHIFVKQELDGIIYQTVPMPSDSSYKIGVTDNGDAFHSGVQFGGSGHLRVTVAPDSITVAFISAVLPEHETDVLKNGDIIYSYSVKKSGTTSISTEDEVRQSVQCYPNPFSSRISLSGNTGNEEFELYNVIGARLWKGSQIENQDFSFLKNGVYILNVNNSKHNYAIKLIKR